MIRIYPYTEHIRGREIWCQYLYLIAEIMPFPPEDILDEDVLEIDGEIIKAENFVEKSGKRPRLRRKEYVNLLWKNGIRKRGKSKEELLEQDYLLASKLIYRASSELYNYIYMPGTKRGAPAKAPGVNRKNLRRLLTARMDSIDLDLKKLPAMKGDNAKQLLKHVFRYDKFTSSMRALEILKLMDTHVCPYCNRMYTITLSLKTGESRPQFDHFKSKLKYPYFAVSILNLVPCCGLCNSAKKDSEKDILYPYYDEMGTDIVFRTKIHTGVQYLTGELGAEDEFDVELKPCGKADGSALAQKAERSDEVFHLTKLYNEHKDYILSMFRQRYIFSEAYLEMLFSQFDYLFESSEDIRSILYMMDVEKEGWGRRPLGKLTHDIDCEITELIHGYQDI